MTIARLTIADAVRSGVLRFARAVGVALLLGACTTKEPSEGPVSSRTEASAEAQRRSVEIVVRNGTDGPIQLDHGLGPTGHLRIVDASGSLAPVALFDPPHHCDCPCAEVTAERTCPCQPVVDELVELAPGAEHRVTLEGRLRRQRPHAGSHCFDVEVAPPGRYLMRACDRSQLACAVATLEFPGNGKPVVLELRRSEPESADCADRPRLQRAGRVALAAARLHGVAEAHLRGCDASAVVCGANEPPPGPACGIALRPRAGWLEVAIHPAPAAESPHEITVRLDPDAIDPGRVRVSANRWGVALDAKVRIVGRTTRASHSHGGPAARVSSSSFVATNDTDAPVELRVRHVAWLTDHSCEPPVGDGKTIEAKGIRSGSDPTQTALDRLQLPPHATVELSVGFEPRRAYQGHCDRFATAVAFEAGDAPLTATAETNVIRRTPLRRTPTPAKGRSAPSR